MPAYRDYDPETWQDHLVPSDALLLEDWPTNPQEELLEAAWLRVGDRIHNATLVKKPNGDVIGYVLGTLNPNNPCSELYVYIINEQLQAIPE